MNAIWKDFIMFAISILLVLLTVYALYQQSILREYLSIVLLSILLIAISMYLWTTTRQLFYNFGLWFSCRC